LIQLKFDHLSPYHFVVGSQTVISLKILTDCPQVVPSTIAPSIPFSLVATSNF
jgi:hypothetical protein